MIEFVSGPCGWDRAAPTRLRQMSCGGLSAWQRYSTARLLDGSHPRIVHESPFSDPGVGFDIQVELLSDKLTERWQRTALGFAKCKDLNEMNFHQVLERSLGLIRLVEPIFGTVSGMCRSLHVLRASDVGFDCSYSEPSLPFSIFASCPIWKEVNQAERLAENIVHEALHLQLSLVETIESIVVKCRNPSDFYSPWKSERRPVHGVLHGVYVFGNLRYFWTCIGAKFSAPSSFAEARVKEIDDELACVKDIANHPSLTKMGRSLARSLLCAH